MEGKKIHPDICLGLIGTLLAGYVFLKAGEFPEIPQRFPRIFAVVIGILTIIIFVQGIRKTLKGVTAENVKWKEMKYGLMTGGILAVYAIAIPIAGFFVATTVFLAACMFFMGVRSWKVIFFSTLGTDLAVWLIFVKILSVSLP